MSWAGVAAGVSAAAAAQAGIALSKDDPGSSGTSTTTATLPPWLLKHAKTYIDRQYQLSNQPYNPYPGFYQQMAAEGAAVGQKPQFFGQEAFNQPSNQNGGNFSDPLFSNAATNKFNPMAAMPGQQMPLPINNKDYTRYLEMKQQNPAFSPKIVTQKQLNVIKNAAGKMFGMMKDNYMVVPDNEYQQYLSQQMPSGVGMPNQSRSPLFDQYLGANTMKNLGF